MLVNATLYSVLSAAMSVLSVIAAATWSNVVPPNVAFYVVTGTLALNAGLHALNAVAKP
jgi:hypothetical protein